MSLVKELCSSLFSASPLFPAGCDWLHLLYQDPHERTGPAGPTGDPVAGGEQHHRLPTPPHPLRPLLPAGPAGVTPTPAPPQRPTPARPQVAQIPSTPTILSHTPQNTSQLILPAPQYPTPPFPYPPSSSPLFCWRIPPYHWRVVTSQTKTHTHTHFKGAVKSFAYFCPLSSFNLCTRLYFFSTWEKKDKLNAWYQIRVGISPLSDILL